MLPQKQESTDLLQLAQSLSESSFVPAQYKGKPADVLIAMQMGCEVGLKPLQAVQNISVINGRPSIWGDAAIALCRAHPDCEYITEIFDDDTMTAICKGKRRGQPEEARTFSEEDAKIAGLWGKAGPWKQYPKRMLQMRARGFLLRDLFPDSLSGLAIAEEARDIPVQVNDPAPALGTAGLKAVVSAPQVDDDLSDIEAEIAGIWDATELAEWFKARRDEWSEDVEARVIELCQKRKEFLSELS